MGFRTLNKVLLLLRVKWSAQDLDSYYKKKYTVLARPVATELQHMLATYKRYIRACMYYRNISLDVNAILKNKWEKKMLPLNAMLS